MYEPYPTSARSPQPPQRGEAPASVQRAVKFMYAGAALNVVYLIVGLATIGNLKTQIRKALPHDTASQINKIEVADIVLVIVVGLIGIGLWIWMARANAAGHNYARIMGTVLFGIDTLVILLSFARPHASLGLVFNLLVWLAGLGAVFFLWNRDSGPYFTRQPAP